MTKSTVLMSILLLVSAAALIVGVARHSTGASRGAVDEADGELSGLTTGWFSDRGRPQRDGIGVIDVVGVIQFGTEQIGPFSSFEPSAERVAQRLRSMRREERIKAIVLRVNSPGGSLAASQEIYEEVRRTAREAGKPVVVSMGDVAASGGYYVSAPATRIMAHPGTITGSIGVIVSGLNLHGLMERYGVSMNSFTSGKNKDTLAYWRDPRPDEIEMMNRLVGEAYQQFFQAVVDHREIPAEELRASADGRIILGSQAKELGLVDALGGFRDAVRIAAELAELDPEDPYLYFGEEDLFERFGMRLGSLVQRATAGRSSAPLAPTASWPGAGFASLPISYMMAPPAPAHLLRGVAP